MERRPFKPIKVPYSSNWMSQQDLPNTVFHANERQHIHVARERIAVPSLDWTYSSDYNFSLRSLLPTARNDGGNTLAASIETIVSARDIADIISNQSGQAWSLAYAERSGVDYDLLRRQDLPILFYDEFLLYQDDLEDCGEVDFEAKVRVMPNCWFLLIKLYLRVDGAILRTRETRLFHQFESSESAEEANREAIVHVEILWREYAEEETNQEDHRQSLTGGGNGKGGDSDSGKLSALLVSRESRTSTHLVPVVNQLEGIREFYTLTLRAFDAAEQENCS